MPDLFFDMALLPDGWARSVRGQLRRRRDHGRGRRCVLHRCRPPCRDCVARHAQPAQPCVPARHGRPGRGARDRRRQLLDLARGDVPLPRPARRRRTSRRSRRSSTSRCWKAGFTAVAEFHYLHHDLDGRPTPISPSWRRGSRQRRARPESASRCCRCFYAHGGFGGAPPDAGPATLRLRRPTPSRDSSKQSRRALQAATMRIVGVAPHRLRAVTPERHRARRGDRRDRRPDPHPRRRAGAGGRGLPRLVSGRRPVEWLLDKAGVDARWCLIHATHMTGGRDRSARPSGAVAGLCPITEANLGDGIFHGVDFLAADGRFGVGSDSNVEIESAAELRQLEYSQRLRDRRRARFAEAERSVGRTLYEGALAGGAQACGRSIGKIVAGRRADLVPLDGEHPALVARTGDAWLDGWVFSGDNAAVREVWVGGRLLVEAGPPRPPRAHAGGTGRRCTGCWRHERTGEGIDGQAAVRRAEHGQDRARRR